MEAKHEKLHGIMRGIGMLSGTLKSKVKLSGVINLKESSYSTDDFATAADIDELFEEEK